MKILVDITHPAYAHFYRYAIQRWQQDDHDVLITSRAKDITQDLLNEFGFDHIPLGRAKSGFVGLGLELVDRARRLQAIVSDFQPDVATAAAGTFLVYGTLFRRIPNVIFYDTEHDVISNTITYPLATVVITPRSYNRNVRKKQIRYNGYHSLAYTHPSVFTPDPTVLAEEGLQPGEPFTILRLVNWKAVHDFGDYGVTNLDPIVDVLSQYGRVVISSEDPLPDHLKKHELKGPRTNMLHLQAFAQLFFGESATMCSECAMLGTPAIFLSTSRRGYIDELQARHGMVFAFHDPNTGQEEALSQARQLLSAPDTAALWQQKREKMLSELIDVSEFIYTMVLRYGDQKS